MIAAVLLAAGESRRMGRPKLTLPWGTGGSVISQVVARFRKAGAEPLLVVTGGDREEIERALQGAGAQCLFNPNYRQGKMLSSIKVGLGRLLDGDAEAALVAPADLPSLTVETLRSLLDHRRRSGEDLIVPSYEMRRGHPVLIGRPQWQDVLELKEGETLRNFLRRKADQIDYVVVDDPGVIQDLDTPEDYEQGAPC
ncbi:MAG TPA: nucleotidyltransferase family protein [Anaerolineales bacterium]